MPIVSTGQPDRKRQNNQRGDKDILIESSPYRVLKSHINTGIQVIEVQITDYFADLTQTASDANMYFPSIVHI